jgi:hypothetical protein
MAVHGAQRCRTSPFPRAPVAALELAKYDGAALQALAALLCFLGPGFPELPDIGH